MKLYQLILIYQLFKQRNQNVDSRCLRTPCKLYVASHAARCVSLCAPCNLYVANHAARCVSLCAPRNLYVANHAAGCFAPTHPPCTYRRLLPMLTFMYADRIYIASVALLAPAYSPIPTDACPSALLVLRALPPVSTDAAPSTFFDRCKLVLPQSRLC